MDDHAYQQLLQMMTMGRSQENQAGLLQQALAERAEGDPRLQLILQYLAQRQGVAEEEEEEDELADALPASSAPLPQPELAEPAGRGDDRQALRLVQQKVTAWYVELQEMRRRNALFALAVGACKECWGNDPACPSCQGLGRPGAYEIDQRAFAELIAPALPQIRASRADAGAEPGNGRRPPAS